MGLFVDCLYLTAMGVASPYLLYKVLTRPRHLHGLKQRLGFELPEANEKPCIWVHGVSVGEVLAARTFIAALTETFNMDVVISTTTSTGQEVARKNYQNHKVFYFPIDFSWSVSRLFEVINPKLIVLVELELWPNFLQQAQRRNIPVAVVNGRISERSARRYGMAPAVVASMLQSVNLYCVQTEDYQKRFLELGVPKERLHVTDTMKVDNLPERNNFDAQAIRERLHIDPEAPVLLGGSTHPSEETALLECFKKLRPRFPKLRLILVPRHNERSPDVEKEITQAGETVLLYSKLDELDPSQQPVILVDVMGKLGELYAAADLCFIGGSLIKHGGQNMLEPAGLGKVVLFGPHTFNFQRSVEDLLGHDAAIQVEDATELEHVVGELLANPERCQQLGSAALATLNTRRGATKRTIEKLSELLSSLNEKH